MLTNLFVNSIELYYVALTLSVVVSGVLTWSRRPWLILSVHVLLTLWVLFSEANSVVEDRVDRDAIFMIGVFFRVLVCNLIVLAAGQILRMCFAKTAIAGK